MEQRRAQSVALTVLFLGAFCISTTAQHSKEHSPGAAVEGKVVTPAARLGPFSPGGPRPEQAQAIEFRSADQITGKDRELVANAQSSISELAGYAELEFNQGQWSYKQVVCAALPNHIFLRFTRNNGTGDVSLFTASIPRGQEGRIRIIPIQIRGYSLFSPAPINALTVSAFNHIRAEENPDNAPVADWLGTGLCYGALAGVRPQAPVSSDIPEKEKYPVPLTATLEMPKSGGAIISFADSAAVPRSTVRTMIFDGKGRLLQATRLPLPLISGAKTVHPIPADQLGKSRPAKQFTQVTKPAPAAPTGRTIHPVSPASTVERANPLPPAAPA